MVPPPQERMRIIEKSHLLGHFQAQSILYRIKEIKPILNDPALALKFERIFHRIGINLVLGLQETDNGYKGIFVIILLI